MTIPYRERGYSIELDTLIVHERYQDHAPNARRTSHLGVYNVSRGGHPIPCAVCFPPPPEPKRPRRREAPVIEEPVQLAEDGTPSEPTHDAPGDPYWQATSGVADDTPAADEGTRDE